MKMTSERIYPGNFGAAGWRALLAGAVLGLLAVPFAGAQQALPFYEPFSSVAFGDSTVGYGTGEELGAANSSGNIWDTGNGVSSSCARIESYAALEYPGLTNIDLSVAQSYGLMSYQKDTGSTKSRAALLTITPGTTLYASCLLNILTPTNAGAWAFFGLSPTAATGSSVSQSGATVYFNAAQQLQVSKNSSTPATNTTFSLNASNTYLVVLRYKYNSGSPDQVDLWVNPTSLGNDGAIPPPNITTTSNANVTTLGSVAYFQAANPTLFYLDEIRVAYDWAGVTPTTPAAGPIFNVTGGGSGCAGDNFAVGLSGSVATNSYWLYTNGVFTGESVDGTGAAVSFGGQDGTAIYTVLATNEVTGDVNWMATNAAVTVLSLPNIATQPAPVLVATNALAVFNVSSAGSGLNYQWYRNGAALTDGGHVSGSQTATLTISPATTADVATKANGYYVIVANRCGNGVVSVTNGLTLDAPANLVWYGDGVSNLWDVATSSNWNYSATLGYATNVFHFGDNVTFDDTSANTTVNLANTNLSPLLITINGSGSQNYTFAGPGLAGPGSILMNSLGALNLNAVSTETGGIVISNGIIYFAGSAALGSGPITLAGGSLAAPNSGLVTINNPITVTATNSTIAFSSAGGQPLVIPNPINGLAGTLIFSNWTTKAATPSIELTASNFTFNLPVDLNAGVTSGGGLLVGGFNTAGAQIWNGLITDTGGMDRNGSGGTTVLNNTNTYTGTSDLVNGIIGLGADSAQSSPPTIDAGPLGTGTLTITAVAGNTQELYASGGAHVVANPINYTSNLFGAPLIIGGSNSLTLSGPFDLSGTNRVIQTANTGATILSGVITDDGLVNGLIKTGAGTLYLDGDNTYTGDTTNSAGTLAGSGSVAGPVVVLSGATLGAGDPGVIPGTFTIDSDLTLVGNVAIRVNESEAQSNDLVTVTGNLANTGTGTVTVANTGPALKVGDSFTIFSTLVTGGNTLTVSGGGVTWSNHLAVDGGITVTGIAPTSPPVFLSTVLSGANLVSAISNGAAGSTFYVLASTNLALPIASWTPVLTNTYPGGNFFITNPVAPGTPRRFFLLSPNP